MTSTSTAPAPAQSRPVPQLGPAQAAWLVATREITAKLRSKTFLISTGVLLAIALVAMIASSLLADRSSTTEVAVVGPVAGQLSDTGGIEVQRVDDRAAAEQLITDGTVDAAVVPAPDAPAGVLVIAGEEAPGALVEALSVRPEVELLEPSDDNPAVRYFAAFGFGIAFFMSAITFGGMIAQSVVEEKQTRVVEILLSTIDTRTMLTGKVIGNSLLAFGQVVLLAGVTVLGLTLTGNNQILQLLGAPIAWFVIFFVLGFVLLATMFAAAASLVSRQEELQSTMTPVSMLVMIPYFAVIIFNSNELVVRIMSYVPFSAAVGMPFRIFLGDAAWWEPLLSLVILLVTAFAVIGLAARIYDNALLRTGAKVSLRDALHG